MALFLRLSLLFGAAITVSGTSSCAEGAASCSADAHIDGIDSTNLYLLQTDIHVHSKKSNTNAHKDDPDTSSTKLEAPASGSTNASEAPCASDTSPCTPQCTWTCGTAKCDETCEPKCQAPRCQTRCESMNTEGCKIKCDGKPECSVVCSKEPCIAKDCKPCKTTCTEPLCSLECPQAQNCTNVCEDPICEYECKEPEDCPKPECSLSCDLPKECTKQSYKDLPAIKEGQTIMNSFEASGAPGADSGGDSALVDQGKAKASLVSTTRSVEVQTAVRVPGSKELKIEKRMVELPVVQ